MIESGWVAIGVSLLVTILGGVFSHGVNARVTEERITRMAEDVKAKIDRKEFEAGMERLEELHKDLREIRDLLLRNLAK